jgi:hypothetical protein
MADKVRYTMALPKQVSESLEELAEKESMSKPEILRRAIALYYRVYNDVIQGNQRLCIINNDDSIKKEIIF